MYTVRMVLIKVPFTVVLVLPANPLIIVSCSQRFHQINRIYTRKKYGRGYMSLYVPVCLKPPNRGSFLVVLKPALS